MEACGYTAPRFALDYRFDGHTVPYAGFSDTLHDTRSACIGIIEVSRDPAAEVEAIRSLAAPVVLAWHADALQWWKQTAGAPQLCCEPIPSSRVAGFFREHKTDLNPRTIFEGKTLRRLPGRAQLTFVDAGLLPFVERTEGGRLSALVEAAIRDIKASLAREFTSETDANNAIKATFWLLAAKLLHDKNVDGFKNVALSDIDDVFARVGRHYGVPDGVPPPGKAWHAATTKAAERIERFDSLRNLSTESLSHVYENALVTPEVRKANGTHSTPSALVDYMVWQLWPWIEDLPSERRHVFEPACGHAAFLVGALRVLRQWSNIGDANARHGFLTKHLHGIEYDAFAWEVARLRLTLADIPHGNRWDLVQGDMYLGKSLEHGAAKCGVLLANPPYERFTAAQRTAYAKANVEPQANTKACEMLRRTIPHLGKGACFGVVVPLGFLHGKEATELRRTLLSEFDLKEIATFEDQLFEKSDHEAAVILGRRKTGRASPRRLWFRRVRNAGVAAFRDRFAFSSEEQVPIERFPTGETADLRLPELEAVWEYLSDAPRLGQLTHVGQGLSYKGKDDLPRGAWPTRSPAQRGDSTGFANVPDDLAICGLPPIVGMNLDPAVISRPRSGKPTGKPQVLFNFGPVGRNRWQIKAIIDDQGRAITSRWIAVRPRRQGATVLYYWAVLNSPVANAFADTHSGKRAIDVGTMRTMPVPRWSKARAESIEQAALRYRSLATSPGQLFNKAATPEGVKRALLDMDAAVLRAYDLPPRLERQLLDLFAGAERKGVGCEFGDYFPADFRPCIPLHEYLSDEYKHSTAGELAGRFQPARSKAALAALDRAEELAAGD